MFESERDKETKFMFFHQMFPMISEYDLNYLITSFVPSCDPDHLFDLAEMHFRTQIENDAKSYQLAMYASFIGITIIKREIHTITQNVL